MILLILIGLLTLIAMSFTFITFADDSILPMPGFGALVALVVGGVGFCVWGGLSLLITYNTDDLKQVHVEKYELRALDTGSDSEGQFFLGSGYFSSGPSYTYLKVGDDGAFEMDAVATGNALVYQVDDIDKPYVVFSRVQPASMLWSVVHVEAKVEFYVPKGSVQEPEYRVSMER